MILKINLRLKLLVAAFALFASIGVAQAAAMTCTCSTEGMKVEFVDGNWKYSCVKGQITCTIN